MAKKTPKKQTLITPNLTSNTERTNVSSKEKKQIVYRDVKSMPIDVLKKNLEAFQNIHDTIKDEENKKKLLDIMEVWGKEIKRKEKMSNIGKVVRLDNDLSNWDGITKL